MSFDAHKRAAMAALVDPREADHSPKGGLDAPIAGLVGSINAARDYATTSSCSGRIAVFHFAAEADAEADADADAEAHSRRETKSTKSAKGAGTWLLAEHATIDVERLERALASIPPVPKKSKTLLKHEPFVMHVLCRSPEAAQAMLTVALEAGFRESGISLGASKTMLGVRTSANVLEVPLAVDGRVMCSREMLSFLVEEANVRFRANAARVAGFEALLRAKVLAPLSLPLPPPQKPITPIEWTVAPASNQLHRWSHTATPVGQDGLILVFGGWGEEPSSFRASQQQSPQHQQQQHSRLSHPLILDARTGALNDAALRGEPPSARVEHTAVLLPGLSTVVVLGGRSSPSNALPLATNVKALEWPKRSWVPFPVSDASAPAPRWAHVAVALPDDRIIVFGGRDLAGVFSDVWVLSQSRTPSTKPQWEWTCLETSPTGNDPTNAPGPRFAHAAALLTPSLLLVHGGLVDTAGVATGAAHILNLDTREWTRCAWSTPSRFSHAGVAVGHGRVLLTGGVASDSRGGCFLATAEDVAVVPSSDAYGSALSLEALPVRHAVAVVPGSSAAIVSVGGGANCFAFGTVFGATMVAEMPWAWVPPAPSLTPLAAAAAAAAPSAAAASFLHVPIAAAESARRALTDSGFLDKKAKVDKSVAGSIGFPLMAGVDVSAASRVVGGAGSSANPSPPQTTTTTTTTTPLAVVCPIAAAEPTRRALVQTNLLDKTTKVAKFHGFVGFPLLPSAATDPAATRQALLDNGAPTDISIEALSGSSPSNATPANQNRASPTKAARAETIAAVLGPHAKVERIDDVLLVRFGPTSATDKSTEEWAALAHATGAARIVLGAEVDASDMRQSQCRVVFPPPRPLAAARGPAPDDEAESCWVRVVEFGVQFRLDLTRCMYSHGNVAEKRRFASLVQPHEIVVDLFAGIGYFTLPALVLGKARLVHACEWNPNALRALRLNLSVNGVEDRCVIHAGDCRDADLDDAGAHRVSLGLLPSAEVGYVPALRCLSRERGSGWLHIHANASVDDVESGVLAAGVLDKLRRISNDLMLPWREFIVDHVQTVKSYAPRVVHVVLDVYVSGAKPVVSLSARGFRDAFVGALSTLQARREATDAPGAAAEPATEPTTTTSTATNGAARPRNAAALALALARRGADEVLCARYMDANAAAFACERAAQPLLDAAAKARRRSPSTIAPR